jgi:hypothetical protein
MRKLSVASIASNFTKRSGSMASLHKTAEDDESCEAAPQKATATRTENNSSESNQFKDIDDSTRPRLSVIQDEKGDLQQRDSFETPGGLSSGANGSPASTFRRLATLKVKTSWGPDGQRMVTPPLRTSSANSVNQTRITQLPPVTDLGTDEKENIRQVQPVLPQEILQKQGKRSKAMGRNVVAEGIRNLFR